MAKGKLKHALLAQQASAARSAQKKRAEGAAKDRQEAIERSLKRQGKKPAKAKSSQGVLVTDKGQLRADGGAPGAGSSNISTGDPPSAPTPANHAKASGKPPGRATIPFDSTDTILLLGEANLSFALSLFQHHHHPPTRLCATSYDSQEVCFRKYPDAASNVQLLRDGGVRVEFGVDAGKLEGYKWVGKGRWSRVIFNFPHAGAGITDQDRNILTNQILLLRTFRSVAAALTSGPSRFPMASSSGHKTAQAKASGGARTNRRRTPDSDNEQPPFHGSDDEDDGEYHDHEDHIDSRSLGTTAPPAREGTLLITLLDQPPYTLWDLRRLGLRPPAVIPGDAGKAPTRRYRLLRSFAFDPSAYPGYAHRRTLGFKPGVSKAQNEEIEGRKGGARTWEFALAPLRD